MFAYRVVCVVVLMCVIGLCAYLGWPSVCCVCVCACVVVVLKRVCVSV